MRVNIHVIGGELPTNPGVTVREPVCGEIRRIFFKICTDKCYFRHIWDKKGSIVNQL